MALLNKYTCTTLVHGLHQYGAKCVLTLKISAPIWCKTPFFWYHHNARLCL